MPTGFSNCYYRLTRDKELNIACIGGSITHGAGASTYSKSWVALTTSWLKEHFPDAEIHENNAGVSNTGSNYGIFRLQRDIFDVAIPDLMFIEYTSNDWERFGETVISKQTESIIRMLYEKNPKMDIIFLFTYIGYDGACRNASRALAKHYGLEIIDPGSSLKTLIDTEEGGVYDKYSGDKIHPNDTGHAFYLKLISDCLAKHLLKGKPETAQYIDYDIPQPFNKSGLFTNPEIVDVLKGEVPAGFEIKQKNVTLGNGTYEYALCTETEGAEYIFTFNGTGFGLLVFKTPFVSNIEYSVDGGEYVGYAIGDMQAYNHGQMYIPEFDLERGEHTVAIRNVASKFGTQLNILALCINK